MKKLKHRQNIENEPTTFRGRIDSEVKKRIVKVAEMRGQSYSLFMVEAADDKAKRILKSKGVVE